METNWIIIGVVVIIGLALVIYLIWKNQKDEEDVVEYFNNESSNFHEEESELNDEK
ncbi:hypothetical protein [Flavobacterium sangjuense]|uniref:Uncharacterized protein n=1 Tax=Flavobacterium sangjuense TaxID=2518177 RepID=A0A4P7PQV5_9FLAO|nr:hypothetical protein [Flavobacterium sangjuense]QBZ96886.1 hypothetical protein GS03_00369 [Flavobacterium sangjuense]